MLKRRFGLAFLLAAVMCGVAWASDKPCEDLRLAIEDLKQTFPDRYARADEFLRRLDEVERTIAAGGADAAAAKADLSKLQREALLANPLLDVDRLLCLRREQRPEPPGSLIYYKKIPLMLGLPSNFNSNSDLPPSGWDDRILVMRNLRDEPQLTDIYRPEREVLVADLELHWDAEKLLFSSIDASDHWHIYEIGIDGTGLR
jgi:hypothetical protein